MANTVEEWINEATPIFKKTYGLSDWLAGRCAALFLHGWLNGLNPRITSGYRSIQHQSQLRQDSLSGKVKTVVTPAKDSLHTRTSFTNDPAAEAFDMRFSNQQKGIAIARTLGLGIGADFKTPDEVHFFNMSAR